MGFLSFIFKFQSLLFFIKNNRNMKYIAQAPFIINADIESILFSCSVKKKQRIYILTTSHAQQQLLYVKQFENKKTIIY